MIEDIVARGIITGYPDYTLRPNEPIKRQHMAVMIARTFELSLKRKDVSFSDVSTSHPYYEAIMSIQQAGVVNGSTGAFTPDESKRMIQERVLINLFSKHALFFACLSRLLVLI